MPAGEEPFFAAIDRSGAHLYIVDYGTGLQDSTISQFTIGADDSLTTLAPVVAAGAELGRRHGLALLDRRRRQPDVRRN